MAARSRVSIIGRSFGDIAMVWGALQSFFIGADLVVTQDPVGRALEGPTAVDAVVIVLIDRVADAMELENLELSLDWLLVLCAAELLQVLRCGLLKKSPLSILPFEDAPLAVMGATPLLHQASGLSSTQELP